jgi:hypothetical protein
MGKPREELPSIKVISAYSRERGILEKISIAIVK